MVCTYRSPLREGHERGADARVFLRFETEEAREVGRVAGRAGWQGQVGAGRRLPGTVWSSMVRWMYRVARYTFLLEHPVAVLQPRLC